MLEMYLFGQTVKAGSKRSVCMLILPLVHHRSIHHLEKYIDAVFRCVSLLRQKDGQLLWQDNFQKNFTFLTEKIPNWRSTAKIVKKDNFDILVFKKMKE